MQKQYRELLHTLPIIYGAGQEVRGYRVLRTAAAGEQPGGREGGAQRGSDPVNGATQKNLFVWAGRGGQGLPAHIRYGRA